jgi:hypothetical protein
MSTYYQDLSATGSNGTTLNDAPNKDLSATVVVSPVITRSPIRSLVASAGSAVSMVRVLTRTMSTVGSAVSTVTKLIGHIFNALGEAFADFIEQHWGSRPFRITNAERNWSISEGMGGGWSVTSTQGNWSFKVLGD